MPGLLQVSRGTGNQLSLMMSMREVNESFLKTEYVLYFWAIFDLFYIARFIWLNISQGQIPLIDDILSFSNIYPQGGIFVSPFSFSLLLNISIIFSAVMYLKNGSM
jgi:hypothetical protein